MKTLTAPRCILVCAALCGAWTAPVQAEDSAAPAVMSAVRHGECDKAIKAVNDSMNSRDAQIDFVAGRMVDEGVCVNKDSAAAIDYYKRSLELGNRASALDYATKVGLGQGAAQSYEQAGQLCRTGGIDAGGQLSTYSLGYACTLRGLTGELLRESLPKGAIPPGGGSAMVSFTPADGAMKIRSLPHVSKGEASLGSNIRHPMVDASQEIQKAWQQALAQVPKPDPTKLDNKSVDLPLDVEMTIEMGRDAAAASGSTLQSGELIRHPN